MNEDSMRRAYELFDDVCDLDADSRAVLLDERCAGDPKLRAAVEKMLRQDQTDDAGLTPGAGAGLIAERIRHDDESAIPSHIGPYSVIREIGRGGMGVVYEAEQASPKRRVALKVMRDGFASEEIQQRFRRESQLLGQLLHPGIAHIYEAGTENVSGRTIPYFAMEFIEGESVDVHIRENEPSRHDILQLFVRICDAVQHAHQKGIIHRDLKPSNVLVKLEASTISATARGAVGPGTVIDAVGQPKILDFGVARLADQDAHTTIQTQAGQLVGTLAYMSPEQLEGDPAALDTRCDVYALGVMLYRTLSGKLPVDIAGKPVAEAARLVRDTEPRRLGLMDSTLKGDVETIVAKAIEKDPARRYASAAALGEDIRRYLDREPITARPASSLYQMRKFASRNRALVGGITATFVVLVLGVVGTAIGLASSLRANEKLEQTNEALTISNANLEQANRDLTAVSAFQAEQLGTIDVPLMGQRLSEDLLAAAPDMDRADLEAVLGKVNFTDFSRLILSKNIFDGALQTVDEQFADRPQVRAKLLQSIGNALRDLGLHELARDPLHRALKIRQDVFGDEHRDTIDAQLSIAMLHHEMGAYDEAQTTYESVIESTEKVLGKDDELALSAMVKYSNLLELQGKSQEVAALLHTVVAARERTVGADHQTTLSARSQKAANFLRLQRFDDAEAEFRQIHAAQVRLLGALHQDTLTTQSYLAVALFRIGRADEAVEVGLQALEGRRHTHGNDHSYTLISVGNVAAFMMAAGRFAEAEPLYREALDTHLRINGPDHPKTITALHNLGYYHGRMGDYNAANQYYRRVYESDVRTLGEDNYEALRTLANIGANLVRQDMFTEAEALLLDLLERRRRVLGEEHVDTLASNYLLAKMYLRWEKPEEAEPFVGSVLATNRKNHGEEHSETLDAMDLMAEVLVAQNRLSNAKDLYRKVYETCRESLGEDHPRTQDALGNVNEVLELGADVGRLRVSDTSATDERSSD